MCLNNVLIMYAMKMIILFIGYYRCRGSRICLHPSHVCDDVKHCPLHDDEMLCDLECPITCLCQGHAFICSAPFDVSKHVNLRYLEASGYPFPLRDIIGFKFLIRLDLPNCYISTLPMLGLLNLQYLDLKSNNINILDISSIVNLPNLKTLILSNNPINSIVESNQADLSLILPNKLQILDLSFTFLKYIDGSVLTKFEDLRFLNISFSKITSIKNPGFDLLPNLETIDMKGMILKRYPWNMFRNLSNLKVLYADNFKHCCQTLLPDSFVSKNCHSPEDLFSSCERLIKWKTHQIYLWTTATITLVGNLTWICLLIKNNQRNIKSSESKNTSNVNSNFLINLAVGNLLMGVYLHIVGGADLWFKGHYVYHDDQWKTSVVCKIAGGIAVTGYQVS